MGALYKYTPEFFEYIERGSRISAKHVTTLVNSMFHPRSVLDVGCGRGTWLTEWSARGVDDIFGIDGDYIRRDQLLINPENFSATDLEQPFHLGRRFDLVMCLEVAEHLTPASSECFVESLIRHSDVILFSAATKGQGGENHINERSLSFWHNLFVERGYFAIDAIRPLIRFNSDIERWYRFNSVLYIHPRVRDTLSADVREHEAPLGTMKEIGDLYWTVRRCLLYFLPVPVVSVLARMNSFCTRLFIN